MLDNNIRSCYIINYIPPIPSGKGREAASSRLCFFKRKRCISLKVVE